NPDIFDSPSSIPALLISRIESGTIERVTLGCSAVKETYRRSIGGRRNNSRGQFVRPGLLALRRHLHEGSRRISGEPKFGYGIGVCDDSSDCFWRCKSEHYYALSKRN